jgi:hypothetical protein
VVDQAAPGAPRKVRVNVRGGVQGGTLYVDGKPTEWFGKELSLEPGAHIFSFRPSDPDCCVVEDKNEVIDKGTDVQEVVVRVTLKDASLAFGTLGTGRVMCEFLARELRVPDVPSVRVPMNSLLKSGSCSFFPDNPASNPTVQRVTLKAGQTTTFP